MLLTERTLIEKIIQDYIMKVSNLVIVVVGRLSLEE